MQFSPSYSQGLGANLALKLATIFPNLVTIKCMCMTNHFLTSPRQINLIRKTIQKKKACNLLIFGLGKDSPFYQKINRGGRTAFLEHDDNWFGMLTGRFPDLEAYRVSYSTRVDEWQKYLANPQRFETALPVEIRGTRWDVIFVDAPHGYLGSNPGRMESIRLASVLVRRPGDVFVHDCEREVENTFSSHYLKAENLRQEVTNLQHYAFPDRDAFMGQEE